MGSEYHRLFYADETLPKGHALADADRNDHSGWCTMPGSRNENQWEAEAEMRDKAHQAVLCLYYTECYGIEWSGEFCERDVAQDGTLLKDWHPITDEEMKDRIRIVIARLNGTHIVAPTVEMVNYAFELVKQSLRIRGDNYDDLVKYGAYPQPGPDAY